MSVEIEIDTYEDGIAIGRVITEGYYLEVMAEVIQEGRTVTLLGLNVHGVGVSVNELGPTRLRKLINETMERMDVDEIVIEGAVRVTGAGPGRKPGRLRFKRQAAPAVRPDPK